MVIFLALVSIGALVFLAAALAPPPDRLAGAMDEDTVRRILLERLTRERRAERVRALAVTAFAATMLGAGMAGLFYFGCPDQTGTAAQRLARFADGVPGLIASGTLVILAGTLLAHNL